MNHSSDFDRLERHRAIWARRPELRAVYKKWFRMVLEAVEGREPVIEIGAGPGFLKEFDPAVIATDVLATPWVDVACDACSLPFRSESAGSIIMIDVLHHLAHPLRYMREAARILRGGGRIVMIEPWITPFSYLIYRFLHDEDCTLAIDLDRPFDGGKRAFDGNAAVPYRLVQSWRQAPDLLELTRVEPFSALDYLATLGFKRSRPMPATFMVVAGALERSFGRARRMSATRVFLEWSKS